jgi:cell division protein FtsI (penicillin-binding protein 3)
MNGPPPSDAPPPANRRGTPRQGATPLMENVRVTAPDLQRRAALEKSRSRLLFAAGGFMLLFGAVVAKLASATIIFPMMPKLPAEVARVPSPAAAALADADGQVPVPATVAHGPRAMITDRNGEILAISLPTAGLYANPKEMMDTDDAARKLKSVLPRLDEDQVRTRLAANKQFVYLARQITPQEQLAINALGIPGIYFQPSERRRYPQGRVAAQVLGGVDVDGHGIAGVEKFFDQRLRDDPEPLRLSIDVRVQGVLRDELAKSMDEFTAIGGCGIVMDVRTGEVIAMVSLPDYDANKAAQAPPEDRFNRAVTGMYEPGSTFKLQTAGMALDYGTAQLWNQFDAAHPIHIGRFTITDFEGKHRYLWLPEVLAYSSNLGAAHIAQTVGSERQRAWLNTMGMLDRLPIQLPEAGHPIYPTIANWGESANMTIGFGHGIAVSPLHVVRGTATLANGGVLLPPTLLAHDPGSPPTPGVRIMQQQTSDTVRKLMRLVVTDGYGKPADIPGYFVGGKTGTAEKTSGHGYKKHTNISAFMSVFPMNAPHYAVYFMLDEPHGTKATGGFSTAGAVSAPAAGRVIAKIAPMLGLLPDTANLVTTQAELAIPMQPAKGYISRWNAPLDFVPPSTPLVTSAPVAATPSAGPVIPTAGRPPGPRINRDAPSSERTGATPTRHTPEEMRHEASLEPRGFGTQVAAH